MAKYEQETHEAIHNDFWTLNTKNLKGNATDDFVHKNGMKVKSISFKYAVPGFYHHLEGSASSQNLAKAGPSVSPAEYGFLMCRG